MRRKNIRVGYCRSAANVDYTAAKRNDKELALYKSARNQGIQPSGTRTAQTHYALDRSDSLGRAFDAGNDGPRSLIDE